MATLKCSQCDWQTTKNSMSKAHMSLRMHVGRKHGKVKTPIGPRAVLSPVTGGAEEERPEPQPQMHFCPQCGFNLHILAKAVALASRVTRR